MEEETHLLARIRDGDQRAFAELIRRHRGAVFSIALSVLGQAFVPEAEDVAQEVFLKIHRSLGSFRGDSGLSSWIYRIAFHQAVNVKTRFQSRRTRADETALLAAVSSADGPDLQAENAQQAQVLAEGIATLPDVYQSALRLYYWLGLSVAEIAELLNVPENTAKSYLHRARQLLRTHLNQRGFSHE